MPKRIKAIDNIPLKEADGSPMLNEKTGEQEWARVHTPASKFSQNALAARRRDSIRRVRESGGKMEGGAERLEDKVKFLNAVVEEFSPGVVEHLTELDGSKAKVAAILDDPELGYIRDQLDTATQDWGTFLEASATS